MGPLVFKLGDGTEGGERPCKQHKGSKKHGEVGKHIPEGTFQGIKLYVELPARKDGEPFLLPAREEIVFAIN